MRGIGGGDFQRASHFADHQKVFNRFEKCRYFPAMKDVIKYAAMEILDEEQFPWVHKSVETSGGGRRGSGDRNVESKSGIAPKIIIFMNGGATASEMRTVYEESGKYDVLDMNVVKSARFRSKSAGTSKSVSEDPTKYDVILGTTNRITPKSFLEEIFEIGQANEKT